MDKPSAAAPAQALLRFHQDLLDQALALAAAHERPGAPPYRRPVGAHLRHVIEHYEALLNAPPGAAVDYDGRERDAELEACPRRARVRLLALQHRLAGSTPHSLEEPLRHRGRAGLAGEFGFDVPSTRGRELVFLASHTVHHYALLAAFCQQQGIALPADFGVAPATVAHQRATAASTPLKETA